VPPLLRTEEKGLGDLMYEHFKDRGLTNEEFARFKTGIFEINSRSAMRIPDFDADQFEETPSDKVIILDTNVVSELMRGGPHSAVRAWMNAQSRDSLLTTANTVMELRAGVEKLFASRRRHELEADIDWVLSDLVGNRVLS
jgi:hypothetical protein